MAERDPDRLSEEEDVGKPKGTRGTKPRVGEN
jgi:hypothetical protein